LSQGLRERKKAETRRTLSSAALRLAQEHGPDGVTVEAIADAAGVSPRTFFNYFASKDDAVAGIVPAESSELLSHLLAQERDQPPLDALRGMCLCAAGSLEATADELWARHQLAQQHPALAARRAARFAEVERTLAGEIGRRTGLDPDRDLFPALVVSAAIGALRVALTVWQERGRPGALAEVIDEAFTAVAAGLALPDLTGATGARRA
jgi:AcrR family transcriptional regulator